MRISEAIMKTLEERGIQYIFGISAGTVSAILDAVNDTTIQPIITKNEAGAAYMATRYACVTNKLGVCIGAGAVGANNMINGVADAMRSKVPVLVITGYVHRWQIGKGAIQELNTEEIFKPITKYSRTILEENQVLCNLKKAIEIALTPPYGPVHISIPIDLQNIDLDQCNEKESEVAMTKEVSFDEASIENASNEINKHEHGIIMVGKGCRGLSEEIEQLSEQLQWPIITTPEARGIIAHDFKYNLGNYGFSGSVSATEYVEREEATCLLVLGSSLGESATRNYNETIVKNRRVIHVDWDRNELGKVFDTDIKVFHDLKVSIPEFIRRTKTATFQFNPQKIEEKYIKNHTGISFRLLLDKVVEVLPKDTFYVSDIGEYMNFLFRYLKVPKEGDFEIGLNYGAMGSGVAGVIGVKLAYPKRTVAVFTGDGSFFMNGTEIFTAKEYNLPIIYFVINNAMLGYVEHGHSYLYKRSVEGFKQNRISIKDMMEGAGIKSMVVKSLEDIDKIKEFTKELKEPCVIEIITDGSEPAPLADRFKALAGQA